LTLKKVLWKKVSEINSYQFDTLYFLGLFSGSSILVWFHTKISLAKKSLNSEKCMKTKDVYNHGKKGICIKNTPGYIQCLMREGPPDAMSLRYADTSLPELLGRPRLLFAEMSMRNTSKCACVIQEVFFNLCFKFKYTRFFLKFVDIVAWEASQRWEVFINYHK